MVVSITLLYFGFNFLKGIDFFSTSNKYFIIYENVDKLTESNQVFLMVMLLDVSAISKYNSRRTGCLLSLISTLISVLTDSYYSPFNWRTAWRPIYSTQVKPGGRLNPKDTIRSDVAKGVMDFAEPVATNLQTTLKNLNTILDALARNTKRLDTIFIRFQTTPALLNKTLTHGKQQHW